MSKKNQAVIETIETLLSESNRYWNEKIESHAFIVGYLQGGLKALKSELETTETRQPYIKSNF